MAAIKAAIDLVVLHDANFYLLSITALLNLMPQIEPTFEPTFEMRKEINDLNIAEVWRHLRLLNFHREITLVICPRSTLAHSNNWWLLDYWLLVFAHL